MSKDLVRALAGVGDRTPYRPHSIKNVTVTYGVPPVKLDGIDFVRAHHLHPQWRPVMSLTKKGVHVANNNTEGIIEIAILDGTGSCAAIQLIQLTGIPFPIVATDLSTAGTATIVGTACQQVGTPIWGRGLTADVVLYRFHTTSLIMSRGIRLTE